MILLKTEGKFDLEIWWWDATWQDSKTKNNFDDERNRTCLSTETNAFVQ